MYLRKLHEFLQDQVGELSESIAGAKSTRSQYERALKSLEDRRTKILDQVNAAIVERYGHEPESFAAVMQDLKDNQGVEISQNSLRRYEALQREFLHAEDLLAKFPPEAVEKELDRKTLRVEDKERTWTAAKRKQDSLRSSFKLLAAADSFMEVWADLIINNPITVEEFRSASTLSKAVRALSRKQRRVTKALANYDDLLKRGPIDLGEDLDSSNPLDYLHCVRQAQRDVKDARIALDEALASKKITRMQVGEVTQAQRLLTPEIRSSKTIAITDAWLRESVENVIAVGEALKPEIVGDRGVNVAWDKNELAALEAKIKAYQGGISRLNADVKKLESVKTPLDAAMRKVKKKLYRAGRERVKNFDDRAIASAVEQVTKSANTRAAWFRENRRVMDYSSGSAANDITYWIALYMIFSDSVEAPLSLAGASPETLGMVDQIEQSFRSEVPNLDALERIDGLDLHLDTSDINRTMSGIESGLSSLDSIDRTLNSAISSIDSSLSGSTFGSGSSSSFDSGSSSFDGGF